MEEQVTKRWLLGLFWDLPPTSLSANGNVGSEFFRNAVSLSLSVANANAFFLKLGCSLSLSLTFPKKCNPSGAVTIFGLSFSYIAALMGALGRRAGSFCL